MLSPDSGDYAEKSQVTGTLLAAAGYHEQRDTVQTVLPWPHSGCGVCHAGLRMGVPRTAKVRCYTEPTGVALFSIQRVLSRLPGSQIDAEPGCH